MLWSGKLEARWTEIITEGEVNTLLITCSPSSGTVTKKTPHSLRDPQAFETNYTLLLTVGGGPNRRSVENVSLGSLPGSLGKGGVRQHTFHKLTMGRLYTVCKLSEDVQSYVLLAGAPVCNKLPSIFSLT